MYYSPSDATRTVARAISAELGAVVDPIVEGPRRNEVQPMTSHPRDFDLVVVGTSVVNGAIAPPVRAYLERHRQELRRIALFCTYVGAGSAGALREMAAICERQPVLALGLRQAEVEARAIGPKVRIFARELRPPERSGIDALRRSSPSLVTMPLRVPA